MKTELDCILRHLKVEQLVRCGTQYPNYIRATVFDGIVYGYELLLIKDAPSAQTPEVAKANIIDFQNLGVECLATGGFLAKFE